MNVSILPWASVFVVTSRRLPIGSLPSQQAKRELKVNYNNETLPFCSEPKYLGITLDRSFTYRRHLESLRKKLTSRVALLRRIAGQQCWEQPPQAWYIQPQNTTLLPGAVVLTPASLVLSSKTSCEQWLDACVLHQRIIFLSSWASNLLSFVAKDSALTCPSSGMHGISNRSVNLTTKVLRSGRITDQMRNGCRTLSMERDPFSAKNQTL